MKIMGKIYVHIGNRMNDLVDLIAMPQMFRSKYKYEWSKVSFSAIGLVWNVFVHVYTQLVGVVVQKARTRLCSACTYAIFLHKSREIIILTNSEKMIRGYRKGLFLNQNPHCLQNKLENIDLCFLQMVGLD